MATLKDQLQADLTAAMGQVIKAVRARVGNDADGARVAAAVRAALG